MSSVSTFLRDFRTYNTNRRARGAPLVTSTVEYWSRSKKWSKLITQEEIAHLSNDVTTLPTMTKGRRPNVVAVVDEAAMWRAKYEQLLSERSAPAEEEAPVNLDSSPTQDRIQALEDEIETLRQDRAKTTDPFTIVQINGQIAEYEQHLSQLAGVA